VLLEKKKQKPNNEDETILSDDDFEDEDENLEQRQEINNISSTSLNSFFIPVDDILGSESILILKSLFSGIKKIVQQFNSSTQLIEQLMNKQNERKLKPIQDVISRWNSLYMMPERFLVLFVQLKEVINNQSNEYSIVLLKIL
jgi:hypothetical protein